MSSLAVAADVDVGAVMLQVAGTKLGPKARVDSRITGGTLERTIDGASTLTLTIDDADRTLLRSGLFDRQIDIQLLGLWWRLVQVSKAGDGLTLTFEDRVVAYLRQITKPRKAARSKMTRAEFALSIVREVKGVRFECPDLHVKQKVAIESSAGKAGSKKGTAAPGLSPGAKLTVKGAPATSLQRQNAERVLDVAASLNAGTRAMLALVQAVIVESLIQNLSGGDRDSRGILQIRDSTAGPMNIDNRDIEQCCNAFLTRGFWGKGGAITIAAKNPSMSTGQVAQNTQGSGVPGAYDKYRAEAEQWVAAYGGAAGAGLGSFETTKTVPYQFQRGGTDGTVEDSWACLQRLASEVGWRCFVADGVVWFAAETTLIKAKPLAALSEQTLGVSTIDFDVDNGKADSEATVDARASRLGFPPGSVVELDDCGPADGRWLVKDITRGIFDAHATLTLKRPTVPLPEPAAETQTVTSAGGLGGGIGGGSSFAAAGGATTPGLDQAYATAQAIHAKRFPYVWGGGHARCGVPDDGHGHLLQGPVDPRTAGDVGFDCSGSTCAVLAGGGMGFEQGGGVDVSGTIAARWGEPGEGEHLTVWASEIHVWMEFKTSQGPQHFGTGDWGKGWGGAGFNPQMHPKAGFTPRHWPGT